jgi:hypothetical protein
MSYCRRSSDSDVYVYSSVDELVCFGCRLADPSHHFTTVKRSGMVAHLRDHESRGDKVPGKAFNRLEDEMREIGDTLEVPDWL